MLPHDRAPVNASQNTSAQILTIWLGTAVILLWIQTFCSLSNTRLFLKDKSFNIFLKSFLIMYHLLILLDHTILECQIFKTYLLFFHVWIFANMYVCVLYACLVPLEARREHLMPWNLSYWQAWASIWVLGIGSGSSARAMVFLTVEPLSSSRFIYLFIYLLAPGFSLKQKLINSSRLDSQWVSGIYPCPTANARVTLPGPDFIQVSFGDMNKYLCLCSMYLTDWASVAQACLVHYIA